MSPYDNTCIPQNAYIELGDGTIRIELTKGQFTVIDKTDHPKVLQFRWVAQKRLSGTGYDAVTSTKGSRASKKRIQMHRLLEGFPAGLDVDHWDGNTLNNTRRNRRVATRSQNMANKRLQANNTSGFKGVVQLAGLKTWQARIAKRHIGSFASKEEAARAYDDAARNLYGEFACVNFPTEGERAA